jgi:hypothetical protein
MDTDLYKFYCCIDTDIIRRIKIIVAEAQEELKNEIYKHLNFTLASKLKIEDGITEVLIDKINILVYDYKISPIIANPIRKKLYEIYQIIPCEFDENYNIDYFKYLCDKILKML